MTGLNDLITGNQGEGKPITVEQFDEVMRDLWTTLDKPRPRNEEGHLILSDGEAAHLKEHGRLLVQDRGKHIMLFTQEFRDKVREENQ